MLVAWMVLTPKDAGALDMKLAMQGVYLQTCPCLKAVLGRGRVDPRTCVIQKGRRLREHVKAFKLAHLTKTDQNKRGLKEHAFLCALWCVASWAMLDLANPSMSYLTFAFTSRFHGTVGVHCKKGSKTYCCCGFCCFLIVDPTVD